MTITTPVQKLAGSADWPVSGPKLLFGAAALASLAVLLLPEAAMPGTTALPLVSVSLFGLAGVIALAAWRRPTSAPHPSYLDVAGALTFVGICVAALVEPEQMARLVADFHRER